MLTLVTSVILNTFDIIFVQLIIYRLIIMSRFHLATRLTRKCTKILKNAIRHPLPKKWMSYFFTYSFRKSIIAAA